MASQLAHYATPTLPAAARDLAREVLQAIDSGPLDPSSRYVWDLGRRAGVRLDTLVDCCSSPENAGIWLAFGSDAGRVVAALVRDGGQDAEALTRMKAAGTLSHPDKKELKSIIARRAAAATTGDNANPCVDYIWRLVRTTPVPEHWKQTLRFEGDLDYDAWHLFAWLEVRGPSALRTFLACVCDAMPGDSEVAAIVARVDATNALAHPDKKKLVERLGQRAIEQLPLERVPVANRRLWALVTSSTWTPVWKKKVAPTILASPGNIEATVRALVGYATLLDLKALLCRVNAAGDDATFIATLMTKSPRDLPNRDRERLVRIIVGAVVNPE